MSRLNNRDFNIMDGEYAKVPDHHEFKVPEKHIGLREYDNSVLVHNWFEERNKFEKTEFDKNTTYKLDYKGYKDAVPDTVIRRKCIGQTGGIGSKHLIGMHNTDPTKNLITWYDELINKRERPESEKLPDLREWDLLSAKWLPEKSDFPVQDSPTNWGLNDKRIEKQRLENDRYLSQLPNISEYKDRFQKSSLNTYLQQKTCGIPKEVSATFYSLNKTLNHTLQARQNGTKQREPQARDVLDIVYSNIYNRPPNVSRTSYYLGKVPTDGSANIYRIKDFETLMPPQADYTNNVKETLEFNAQENLVS